MNDERISICDGCIHNKVCSLRDDCKEFADKIGLHKYNCENFYIIFGCRHHEKAGGVKEPVF